MKNLYLSTDTYDLVLSNYNLRVTRNMTEFLAQKIENVLKTFAGEFFANEFLGIPYFTEVFGKPQDIDIVASLFRNAITDIPEVAELVAFSTDFDLRTREFQIDYTVRAIDDTIVENTVEV